LGRRRQEEVSDHWAVEVVADLCPGPAQPTKVTGLGLAGGAMMDGDGGRSRKGGGWVQRSSDNGHLPDVTVSEAQVDVSDVDLWELAVANSDADAFAALYERHVDRVASFVARRLVWGDLDDVTAEVFLATWRQRDRIVVDGESGLLPWLIGVARNMVLEAHRRSGRDARLATRVVPLLDGADPAQEVVDRDEALTRGRRARRALDALGEQDRVVLDLCLVGELTPSQAAVVLGMPASTVRSRLTRARRRLATAYTALEGDEGDRRG